MLTDSHEIRRLIRIRELKKKQKPYFRAQNSWRFKRVSEKWRRPRGIDSKMREKRRGWPPLVNIGYRKPKAVRNLYYSPNKGLREELIVSNLNDLKLALPDKHVIRIDRRVGLRKRERIYLEARSWGLHVLNPIRTEATEEEFEEAEDLSLDRDLGMDLDLEDIEEMDSAESSENDTKTAESNSNDEN